MPQNSDILEGVGRTLFWREKLTPQIGLSLLPTFPPAQKDLKYSYACQLRNRACDILSQKRRSLWAMGRASVDLRGFSFLDLQLV